MKKLLIDYSAVLQIIYDDANIDIQYHSDKGHVFNDIDPAEITRITQEFAEYIKDKCFNDCCEDCDCDCDEIDLADDFEDSDDEE